MQKIKSTGKKILEEETGCVLNKCLLLISGVSHENKNVSFDLLV